MGTWNLVRAARHQNVRSLLMISSDKAVNPICVMGATKRVCERIVSASWQRTGEPRVLLFASVTYWAATEAWFPFFRRKSPPADP